MKALTLLLAATAIPASAANIVIANTGTSGEGTIDPNWKVNNGPAYVNTTAWPIGQAWLGNSGVSRWIQPTANAGDSLDPSVEGSYVYSTSFSLAGLNPATASLNGRFLVDNSVASILLNGKTVATNPGDGFQSWINFSINSGFVAGLNTLTFNTVNWAGPSGNPTGFRAELVGTALSAVPEPATWAMMIVGVGAAGGVMRRRRALRFA